MNLASSLWNIWLSHWLLEKMIRLGAAVAGPERKIRKNPSITHIARKNKRGFFSDILIQLPLKTPMG
jgi:hypothetical protein